MFLLLWQLLGPTWSLVFLWILSDCSSGWLEGPNKVYIPFLACGDLSGYDSDRSYPLPRFPDGTYKSLDPVQPPIAPPYKRALELKKASCHGVQDLEKLSLDSSWSLMFISILLLSFLRKIQEMNRWTLSAINGRQHPLWMLEAFFPPLSLFRGKATHHCAYSPRNCMCALEWSSGVIFPFSKISHDAFACGFSVLTINLMENCLVRDNKKRCWHALVKQLWILSGDTRRGAVSLFFIVNGELWKQFSDALSLFSVKLSSPSG